MWLSRQKDLREYRARPVDLRGEVEDGNQVDPHSDDAHGSSR